MSTPVTAPRLLALNGTLAQALGLSEEVLASPAGIALLSGNRCEPGTTPVALAYAGHQFGNFVPQLGDGRALLLGELMTADGHRMDVQLKGSGRTPFSRSGDGRAAVGPVLREFLVSEAMAALGIPTTRSLAAVATGELVYRERVLPGAVLTRVASSHLRIGTFQYFAARNDVPSLTALTRYAIARHDPDLLQAAHPVRAFLARVVVRQARLIAQWMLVGFIHGVMNTDNCAISGETLDYGPCAFVDAYHPETVYSFIDQQGRYAFGNQPRIAFWNLARLADALRPLLVEESGSPLAALEAAQEALDGFYEAYHEAFITGMRKKLGLLTAQDQDNDLIDSLLTRMAEQAVDWTLFFRKLADAADSNNADAGLRALFTEPPACDEWLSVWSKRLDLENASTTERAALMRRVNPIYIPRNHLVESVLNSAMDAQDLKPFEQLLNLVTRPYDEQPGCERYTLPPRPEERVKHTFCGT